MRRADAASQAPYSSIPLTLVTGFLGSGKSTFINQAIRSNSETRFGVLVNEFGDINIENDIIKAHEEDVVELTGGCMCCRLRGDLIDALQTLLSHTGTLDHLLVEASGLSDPLPIANTFQSTNLESRAHFDAMICMIDALHFDEAYRDYTVAVRQLNYAGFLLITKAESCSERHLTALRKRLSQMAPQARISVLDVDITAADVIGAASRATALYAMVFEISDGTDAWSLSQAGRDQTEQQIGTNAPWQAVALDHLGTAPAQSRHDASPQHPELAIRLCSTRELTTKDAVDQALQRLGPRLLRAKGRIFVSTPEGPYVYYVVQGVAGIREFYPCPRNGDLKPRSALLLVGRSGTEELRLPEPLAAWEIQSVLW